jgi:hypothetical protein
MQTSQIDGIDLKSSSAECISTDQQLSLRHVYINVKSRTTAKSFLFVDDCGSDNRDRGCHINARKQIHWN